MKTLIWMILIPILIAILLGIFSATMSITHRHPYEFMEWDRA